MSKKQMLIVGPGKVGIMIALLAESAGFADIILVGRSEKSLDLARQYFVSDKFQFCLIDDLSFNQILNSEMICIATQDGNIENAQKTLTETVANVDHDWSNQNVFHTSGHKSSESLNDMREIGFRTASLHPIKSVTQPVSAFESFAGTYCAIEGDAKAIEFLSEFVKKNSGKPFEINTNEKALYHAAAVIACNYSITLYDIATKLYAKAGVSEDLSRPIITSLLKGTIANYEKVGTPQALTGPIERGDASTVADHVEALKKIAPEYDDLYRMLAVYTIEVAKRKGLPYSSVLELLNVIKDPESN